MNKKKRGATVIRSVRVRDRAGPRGPDGSGRALAEHPIPFEELWARADIVPLASGTVRVASIPDLIALKRLADRPEDRLDIEALEAILEERRRG